MDSHQDMDNLDTADMPCFVMDTNDESARLAGGILAALVAVQENGTLRGLGQQHGEILLEPFLGLFVGFAGDLTAAF